ncbi:hypothetical protein LOD99_11786 [Oopsacas minuta]|uniref:Homologous-pairing protein 2 homolog n=1 Tax=Oopsacas minuta TaxID=111878 RepID=A0AAV7JLV1_9METZ|nr:hypothetical protein LOD99_11786 [Oopsacas minuta]
MSKKELAEYQKVLAYLRKQNRPYNAQDITSNLNKEVGKTSVQRALDLYVTENKVKEKVYNKTKVYCIEQSTMPNLSDSEMKELDNEISNCEDKIQTLKGSIKALESEIKTVSNSLSLEDTKLKVKETIELCTDLETRLNTIKSSGGKQITPTEKSRIQKQHSGNIGHWKKRKRLASDMLDQILENYPKSKRELLDEIGIETDEEHNVKIPITK